MALNKIDKGEENLTQFKEKYPFPKETLFEISALHEKGLRPLIEKMRSLVDQHKV